MGMPQPLRQLDQLAEKAAPHDVAEPRVHGGTQAEFREIRHLNKGLFPVERKNVLKKAFAPPAGGKEDARAVHGPGHAQPFQNARLPCVVAVGPHSAVRAEYGNAARDAEPGVQRSACDVLPVRNGEGNADASLVPAQRRDFSQARLNLPPGNGIDGRFTHARAGRAG